MRPGDKVGRYKLGEQIGEGAMAQVFASCHPVFELPLAIKVLKKEACWDAHFVARFLDDARTAHGLDHPNIIRVLDVDDSGEQPFIVMELVDGSALDRWLDGRRLEVAEAARIARDIAQALAAAHGAGMVHRDVKPSNVLIDRNTGTVKLTDFGAAKRDRPGAQQLTEMGQRIGTPRYMAPEQVEGGKVDARTDLFALGATLYELLAGRPAFAGDNLAAVYHAILFGEPAALAELRPDAPPELVRLVERLLAREPGARPASAGEVAAALAPYADGASAAAERSLASPPPPAADEPLQPVAAEPDRGPGDGDLDRGRAKTASGVTTVRRRLALAPLVALGAVALVVVGVGAWWLSTPGPEEQPPANEAEFAAVAAPEQEAQPEPAPPGETGTETVTATPLPEEEAEPEPVAPRTGMETAAPPPPERQAEPAPTPPGIGMETAALPPPTEPVPGAPAAVTLDCPADPAAAPGCVLAVQALHALHALHALDGPAAVPPIVTLNRPDGVYFDQDYFVAEVELPDALGGYLYLDLLTDAGMVIHLLPEPLREDNTLPAGGEIRIGVEERERRDSVRHWQVSGSFGDAYLLATVSENRLYDGLRPIEEPIADYRDVLLKALADPDAGRKSAQVERIEFRPRG
ncbi:MAG TPA: protein kinase [Geminicoccaceae bacterium]|nr:protein kinase [Geminicoccaceae bacterium]